MINKIGRLSLGDCMRVGVCYKELTIPEQTATDVDVLLKRHVADKDGKIIKDQDQDVLKCCKRSGKPFLGLIFDQARHRSMFRGLLLGFALRLWIAQYRLQIWVNDDVFAVILIVTTLYFHDLDINVIKPNSGLFRAI
ncbi:hypothetical protein Tco_0006544 [Tanacetum coccineum]